MEGLLWLLLGPGQWGSISPHGCKQLQVSPKYSWFQPNSRKSLRVVLSTRKFQFLGFTKAKIRPQGRLGALVRPDTNTHTLEPSWLADRFSITAAILITLQIQSLSTWGLALCFSANVQGKKERITGRYERKQQCWKIHIPCGDFYINNITLTSEPKVFLATLESRQKFFSILQVEETTWGHITRVTEARCRFRFNYFQKLYDFWYHLWLLQEVLGKR